jgi:peptidoglycan/LPS O-acetylase OafA/YrhL
VVLYHFGITGIGGGFVGVDVFFVISGFLMTRIIVGGLESARFSVWSFYLARVRRIIPALLVVTLVLLAVGWFWLLPDEYQMAAKHAYKSVFFVSNQTYLSEAGYFDQSSHEKWLLHTWSLSVEWQFYVLQPLVLMALWKLFPGRRTVAMALALLSLASLAWCLKLTDSNPAAAFYSLSSRAWELMAGGLVFLAAPYLKGSTQLRVGLECAGFALIIGAIVLLDPQSQWPGWRALFPVLGAALVLLAANQASWFTGSRVAQWLGERSYSIYLWHWPLVVTLVYAQKLSDPLWVAGGLLLTLLLGDQSYRWVEVLARRGLVRFKPLSATVLIVVVVLLCMLPARLIRSHDGYPQRVPAAVAAIEAEKKNYDKRRSVCKKAAARCVYGGPKVAAIMLGDSHADALVSSLTAALPHADQGILLRAANGCFISFSPALEAPRKDCNRLNTQIREHLASELPGVPVVLVTRTTANLFGGLPGEPEDPPLRRPAFLFGTHYDSFTPEYLAEVEKDYLATACQIAKHHPLYLMRPVPEMGVNVPGTVARGMVWGKERPVFTTLTAYHQRHAFIWALQDKAQAQCGAQILDPLPLLCDGERCSGTRNGWPLYFDDDHMSETGNKVLRPMFEAVFKQG